MLLALALLAYPLAVYFLIDTLSPLALAGVLAFVTTIRLVLAKNLSKRGIALGFVAIAALCIATAALQDASAIKLYPVVLSGCGALWCGYTLLSPPSAIERLLNAANKTRDGLPQRMRERIPFDADGLAPSNVQLVYMRRLTATWLVFFVGNALISAATALFANTATWALYNGLISYVLVGALVLGELLYRPIYQRRHEGEPT